MVRLIGDAIWSLIGYTAIVLAVLVIATTAIVVASINPRSLFIETLAEVFGRVYLWATRVTYEVQGIEVFDRERSYVVAPNHLSNVDALLHYVVTPVPCRFLAKKELFRVPIFGQAIRKVGMVETDRSGGKIALQAVNTQVDKVIEYGRSLIIYPEGTRSRDGELKPFKKGAFHIAIRFGMPVVPCTIHGAREAWIPGDWRLRGGHVRVVFADPIETKDLTTGDVDWLRDETRRVIAKTYDRLRSEAAA